MVPVEDASTPEPPAPPDVAAAQPERNDAPAPPEVHGLAPASMAPEVAPPPPAPPERHIHAVRIFSRAFRLALFQEPLHAWIVPFFLLLPYTLLDAFLPEPKEIFGDLRLLALYVVGGLLGLFTTLIVAAMLRVRAAVRLSGGRVHGLDAYARSVERFPVQLLTEIVRSLSVGAALIAFVVPGVVLAQRLSVATEHVVLDVPAMGSGLQRSFELTRGHFRAWVRMVLLTLFALFVGIVGAMIVYGLMTVAGQELAANLAVAPFASACLAVVQYAWTFYYFELGGRAVGSPFTGPGRGSLEIQPLPSANP